MSPGLTTWWSWSSSHLLINGEVFPGSSLLSADVLVELERPVTPLVDPWAGPRIPVGGDTETKRTQDSPSCRQHNICGICFSVWSRAGSVPVGCSHEQTFRRDGEDLNVEGFWAGVQILVVLHIVQTLLICRRYATQKRNRAYLDTWDLMVWRLLTEPQQHSPVGVTSQLNCYLTDWTGSCWL